MYRIILAAALYSAGISQARLVFPKAPREIQVILSILIALLWTYPIGLINTNLIEGHTSIYQNHLDGILVLSIGLAVISLGLHRLLTSRWPSLPRPSILPTTVILVAALLAGYQLDFADVVGDERQLTGIAYDMTDGIKANRQTYLLSFNDHSPLGMFIHHTITNAIHPHDLETLTTSQMRSSAVIMGILTLIALYQLTLLLDKKSSILGLLLTIPTASFLFSARVAMPRDGAYFNFFLLTLISTMIWHKQQKSFSSAIAVGLAYGSLLLVKLTPIVLLPIIIIWMLFEKTNLSKVSTFALLTGLLISPVIVFNIATYKAVGYVDVPTATFMRTLGIEVDSLMGPSGIYGDLTESRLHFVPLIKTLADMHQLIIAVLLLLLAIPSLIKKKYLPITLITLTLLAFFTVTGFRAYYLTSFSLLLTILAAPQLARLKNPTKFALISIVVVFNLVVSYQSLLTPSTSPIQRECGRSSACILPFSFARLVSESMRTRIRQDGWQPLQDYIKSLNKDTQLVFDTDMSSEKITWYTKDDRVRRALDDSYTPPRTIIRDPADTDCSKDFVFVAYKSYPELCDARLKLIQKFTHLYVLSP